MVGGGSSKPAQPVKRKRAAAAAGKAAGAPVARRAGGAGGAGQRASNPQLQAPREGEVLLMFQRLAGSGSGSHYFTARVRPGWI